MLFIMRCNYTCVHLLPHLPPFMDVALLMKAKSLIGPGAHFTLWSGVGIRGDLTQTKTVRFKSSKATSLHATSPQFPLFWSSVKQRLQPSQVRSIIIALQGNLVRHLWMLPFVGRHSCERPGQLHVGQRRVYWNPLLTWSFIILMVSIQLVLVRSIHKFFIYLFLLQFFYCIYIVFTYCM